MILCLLVGVFSVWTYKRNSVWQSGVSLWRDCVEKSPNKARSHLNFGNAQVGQGLIDDAITHYIKALHIRPGYVKAHDNLGVALESQGRTGEAINHYLEALSIKPDNERAHNNLGNALVKQGEIDEAINHYLKALRIKPEYEKAHYNLGNILVQQGRIKEELDSGQRYWSYVLSWPRTASELQDGGVMVPQGGRNGIGLWNAQLSLRI